MPIIVPSADAELMVRPHLMDSRSSKQWTRTCPNLNQPTSPRRHWFFSSWLHFPVGSAADYLTAYFAYIA